MAGFIERNLDPGARFGEVLFGLIMTLTFVLGAGLFSTGGELSVRELLIATIGCNVAWGIIDGVLLVIGRIFDRSRMLRIGRLIRTADDRAAVQLVAGEMDEMLAPISSEPQRLELYRDVVASVRSGTPRSPHPRADDWAAALAVFCLVVFVNLPCVLPFLVLDDPWVALRASNTILIALVFAVGYKWGAATGMSAWGTGISLATLCLVLVLVAIPLGG